MTANAAAAIPDITDTTTTNRPPVEKTRIDWKKTPIPEYDRFYAVILDNIFTAEECASLVARAEASVPGDKKWERAMINIGGGRQMMVADVRNCDRLIFDSYETAAWIWDRVAPHVPELLRLETGNRITASMTHSSMEKLDAPFEMSRLNERLRFLKYGPGEYLSPHNDGMYTTPDRTEVSFVTMHLYLNESTEDTPLVGGATTFHDWEETKAVDVKPKIGRVLLFQHDDLLHSGQEVLQGVKLTMRTDLLYRRGDGNEREG